MDLSIIIVEYMDIGTLEKAIRSIPSDIFDPKSEVIVVSNSSYSQNKQIEIQMKFPGVHFKFNQDNCGFAKGVNQGIAISSGKYIMLLNPDARILDKSLSRVLEFMEANPRIGILGPQVSDRTGQIQDACRDFMTLRKLLLRTFRRLIKLNNGGILENKDYSKSQSVDWVSGACMLVRRKSIDIVGLMDERYFMYMEDMDWCRRFWQHGWEVWYQPDWKVEHNAQRASTTTFTLTNKLMWVHLISLCKYYAKWLKKGQYSSPCIETPRM